MDVFELLFLKWNSLPPKLAFEMTGREMKYISIWKIATKLSFFTEDMFKYVASPTECR